MTDKRKLLKCTLSGGGVFYVVDDSETSARERVEREWEIWGYTTGKGRVVKIEALAEEGQYSDLPEYQTMGNKTWFLP